MLCHNNQNDVTMMLTWTDDLNIVTVINSHYEIRNLLRSPNTKYPIFVEFMFIC